VDAGADLGDVVRIRRIAQRDAEYECVLARKGRLEYDQWIKYCTQAVRNSIRTVWLRFEIFASHLFFQSAGTTFSEIAFLMCNEVFSSHGNIDSLYQIESSGERYLLNEIGCRDFVRSRYQPVSGCPNHYHMPHRRGEEHEYSSRGRHSISLKNLRSRGQAMFLRLKQRQLRDSIMKSLGDSSEGFLATRLHCGRHHPQAACVLNGYFTASDQAPAQSAFRFDESMPNKTSKRQSVGVDVRQGRGIGCTRPKSSQRQNRLVRGGVVEDISRESPSTALDGLNLLGE